MPTITELLTTALHEAVRHQNGEIAPRHPNLRPAHLQLFRTGSLAGQRVTELAARTGMTKQAMHELVTHLEAQGYLVREVDPEDERARRIDLTARGQSLEKEVRAAAAHLHETWQTHLGNTLFAALQTALRKLADPPEADTLHRPAP